MTAAHLQVKLQGDPNDRPTPARSAKIRTDCARKLRPTETGDMFTAILAALLKEDWTTPKIENLLIAYDRCILPPTGEMTHKIFIRAEADLIRNIRGIGEVAGLDGDELAHQLDKVAESRRIE